MKRTLSLVLGLCALVACKVNPNPGNQDSAVFCDGECVSELTLTFADGRETFQVQVYGEELATMNVACPDEIVVGTTAATCSAGQVVIERERLEFPELVRVVVDNGDVQDIFPEYGEPETVCLTTCSAGTAQVE